MPNFTAGTSLGVACISLVLVGYALFSEPTRSRRNPGPGPGGWLQGDPGEKFHQLAVQQRGFDLGMWEIGYRYRELVWGGAREDWSYVRYQLDKIRHSLELAMIRRPHRAAHARQFLDNGMLPLERLMNASEPPSREAFVAARQGLLAACITCHAREQAPS